MFRYVMKFPYIKDPEIIGTVHAQQPVRVLQYLVDKELDLWTDVPIADFALVELYSVGSNGEMILEGSDKISGDEEITREAVRKKFEKKVKDNQK